VLEDLESCRSVNLTGGSDGQGRYRDEGFRVQLIAQLLLHREYTFSAHNGLVRVDSRPCPRIGVPRVSSDSAGGRCDSYFPKPLDCAGSRDFA
jgi:hypothetical protein